MNANDVILFSALLGLAGMLILCLKEWQVMRRAELREKRLKNVCAEYTAACEAAKRAGVLISDDRKHKEIAP